MFAVQFDIAARSLLQQSQPALVYTSSCLCLSIDSIFIFLIDLTFMLVLILNFIFIDADIPESLILRIITRQRSPSMAIPHTFFEHARLRVQQIALSSDLLLDVLVAVAWLF